MLPIKNSQFSNPLLKISFDGGLCHNGHIYDSELIINQDEQYKFYGNKGNKKQGKLQKTELNALINIINNPGLL